MTDSYIPSNDPVIYDWCPDCEPESETVNSPWIMKYCGFHSAGRVIDAVQYIPQGEADGVSGKIWCDLIHRSRREPCP